MAPVQSRLVLAVTVPAAALAIFLSLFWLRRSSKGHPPSPPDIPKRSDKPNEPSPRVAAGDASTDASDSHVSPSGSSEESYIRGSIASPFVDDLISESEKIVSELKGNKLLRAKLPSSDSDRLVCEKVSPVKSTCPVEQSCTRSEASIAKEAPTIKMEYQKDTDIEKSELAEKLASLELNTMKMNEVDVKERDSANHSPSENMLASPSMSNFSDAHSEGSSDSGKGHSDGTSPSRTPPGGSSVSGEPSPSLYEFVVPQVIVGRLIGRHGVFLHEVMNASHTSIFIKVHPNSVKLKICAIEGSEQDIDKALEMIRKKFPLRRYPKLSLERVSFIQLQQSHQLRSEDFHLQLIEGVNNDVIISSLLSPSQMFVQLSSNPTYPRLTSLTQSLTQAYSTTEAPPLVTPVPDAICVCPSLGGWYRAQIVSVDEETRQCDIKFVDYGGYLRVEASLLRQIRADFLMLKFQAVECCLANIQPLYESGWSEEARIFVHNITFGRILQAQVVSYTESGLPLVNLYTSINAQVVLVNTELVSSGYAIYAPSAAMSPPAMSEHEELQLTLDQVGA